MRKRQCHVLVADSDTQCGASIGRRLADAGYRVMTVTTGADVVQRCVVHPPDVLIMDAQLPDMDGFDICSYVRHEYPDAPLTVIMLSEPTDELTRTSLGRMVDFVGGDFFFAKPCDAKLVVKLVNDLVAETPARPTEMSPATFPTRAAWPTTR